MRHVLVLGALVLVGVVGPSIAEAQADRGDVAEHAATGASTARWWISGQVHSAFLTDIAVATHDDLTFGYGATAGHRPGGASFGWTLQLANTWWVQPQLEPADDESVFRGSLQGMVALGIGIEDLYFDRHMRLGFAVGPTLLLRDTMIDDAGTVGFFADFRPAGIRFDVAGLTWVLDPLSFTLAVPDTSGIPLVLIHFNTVLATEFDLEDLGS